MHLWAILTILTNVKQSKPYIQRSPRVGKRIFPFANAITDVHNDGEFIKIVIKNSTNFLLEVHCEVDTPWVAIMV
jgi:hypothetical protein